MVALCLDGDQIAVPVTHANERWLTLLDQDGRSRSKFDASTGLVDTQCRLPGIEKQNEIVRILGRDILARARYRLHRATDGADGDVSRFGNAQFALEGGVLDRIGMQMGIAGGKRRNPFLPAQRFTSLQIGGAVMDPLHKFPTDRRYRSRQDRKTLP